MYDFTFQARLSTPKFGSSSVLRYTPHTELDYGSVVCLATNDIGQQLEPCVFHIIAAGEHEHFIMINDLFSNCTVISNNMTRRKLLWHDAKIIVLQIRIIIFCAYFIFTIMTKLIEKKYYILCILV